MWRFKRKSSVGDGMKVKPTVIEHLSGDWGETTSMWCSFCKKHRYHNYIKRTLEETDCITYYEKCHCNKCDKQNYYDKKMIMKVKR